MKNGKCSKGFPKSFQIDTTLSENGYPVYACPDNGKKCIKKVGGQDVELDNQWVVPYNPWSLMQWKSHVNVECCVSIRAHKYLHKYVYKGHDRTTMHIGTNQNEVQLYLDSRYISGSEACWRIFTYNMYEENPNVVWLAVHTPGGHMVTYDPDNPQLADQIALNTVSKDSTLMAWFKINLKEQEKLSKIL